MVPKVANLVVTQPYIARYRVPLWQQVAELLREIGIRLTVVTSPVRGAQKDRHDDVDLPFAKTVVRRELASPMGAAYWRAGLSLTAQDILVTELDPGNLNAWHWTSLRRRGPAVVLWGHGKSYVNKERDAVERLRATLAKRADATMLYAPGGRASLLRRGVSPENAKVIGNSTDTTALRAELARVDQAAAERFRADLGLENKRVFHYVGGLDHSKRVSFLLRVAEVAYTIDPSFTLVIGGRGAEEYLLDGRHSYLRHIPHVDERTHALLAKVTNGCVVPGRVGLVAIDCQSLGIPLFTTPYPFHAPEIEFLEVGREVQYLTDHPEAFAHELLSRDRSDRVPPVEPVMSVEKVARRFVDACTEASDRRGGGL